MGPRSSDVPPPPRYIGARIGIYNPAGEKVGKVSHLANREYLFFVSKDRNLAELFRAEADTIEPVVVL